MIISDAPCSINIINNRGDFFVLLIHLHQNENYPEEACKEGVSKNIKLIIGINYQIIAFNKTVIHMKFNQIFIFRTLNIPPPDTHNHKATTTMLLLCLIHVICTLPHIIYSYAADTYNSDQHHVYNVLLGIVWFPFGCNFIIYVAQQDQYWNAYKFYYQEKLSLCKRKSTIPSDH